MKEIILTQGKVALVDDEDFEYLNQWKWRAQKGRDTYYAVRFQWVNGRDTKISMHRLILSLVDKSILCDHRDRNGLNNQKYNLRIASYSGNGSNRTSGKNSSSVFLGVSWINREKRWCAQIKKDNIVRHIGYFESEIEAAKAYDKHALEIHGEFANLNFNGL